MPVTPRTPTDATKSTRLGWEFTGIRRVIVASKDLAGERRMIKEVAKLNLRLGWTAALSRIRAKISTPFVRYH
jgi:hypothetical protein